MNDKTLAWVLSGCRVTDVASLEAMAAGGYDPWGCRCCEYMPPEASGRADAKQLEKVRLSGWSGGFTKPYTYIGGTA